MTQLKVAKIQLANNKNYIGKIDWIKNIVYLKPFKVDHLDVKQVKVKGIRFEVIDRVKGDDGCTWCLKLRRI